MILLLVLLAGSRHWRRWCHLLQVDQNWEHGSAHSPLIFTPTMLCDLAQITLLPCFGFTELNACIKQIHPFSQHSINSGRPFSQHIWQELPQLSSPSDTKLVPMLNGYLFLFLSVGGWWDHPYTLLTQNLCKCKHNMVGHVVLWWQSLTRCFRRSTYVLNSYKECSIAFPGWWVCCQQERDRLLLAVVWSLPAPMLLDTEDTDGKPPADDTRSYLAQSGNV